MPKHLLQVSRFHVRDCVVVCFLFSRPSAPLAMFKSLPRNAPVSTATHYYGQAPSFCFIFSTAVSSAKIIETMSRSFSLAIGVFAMGPNGLRNDGAQFV